MKRTLVTTALVLSCSAYAQSSVTIYGLVDLGVGHTNGGTNGTTKMFSGMAAGSRLGFRGTEDLGGGLKANFVLEQGIAADTGGLNQGGLTFGRQTYLGLSSASGWSISSGRQYSPMTTAMASSDALGQGYWGNTQGTGLGQHESPGSGSSTAGYQAVGRVNGSILATYSMGGFTGRGMVGFGDGSGAGRVNILGGTYSSGPLAVHVAAARFRQFAEAIIPGTAASWQSSYVVGGSYDIGGAKLFAGYFAFDPSEANRKPGAPSMADPRYTKTTSSWLGVQVPVTNGSVKAQVMQTSQKYGATSDGKGTTFGATYEHYLSKRTMLYGTYGTVSNNENGRVGLFAAIPAVFPSSPGSDPRAFGMGVKHSF